MANVAEEYDALRRVLTAKAKDDVLKGSTAGVLGEVGKKGQTVPSSSAATHTNALLTIVSKDNVELLEPAIQKALRIIAKTSKSSCAASLSTEDVLSNGGSSSSSVPLSDNGENGGNSTKNADSCMRAEETTTFTQEEADDLLRDKLLQFACEEDSVTCVRSLLSTKMSNEPTQDDDKHDNKVNGVIDRSSGKTALHFAAESLSRETVDLLLAYGAKADVKCKQEKTPLELALGNHRLQLEVDWSQNARDALGELVRQLHDKDVSVVRALVKCGSDAAAQIAYEKAMSGHLTSLAILLVAGGRQIVDSVHRSRTEGSSPTLVDVLVRMAVDLSFIVTPQEAADVQRAVSLLVKAPYFRTKKCRDSLDVLIGMASSRKDERMGGEHMTLCDGDGDEGFNKECDSSFSFTAGKAVHNLKEAKSVGATTESCENLTETKKPDDGDDPGFGPGLPSGRISRRVALRGLELVLLWKPNLGRSNATVATLSAQSAGSVHSPLILAAQAGDDVVEAMLLDAGAPVNGTDADGNTALHWSLATKQGSLSIKVVINLIEAGANLLLGNKLGATAFHFAASQGHAEALKLLLKSNPEGAHSVVFSTRETPLFFAVKNRRLECVRLLMKYGARVDIMNIRNERPVDVAQGADVCELLVAGVQCCIDDYNFLQCNHERELIVMRKKTSDANGPALPPLAQPTSLNLPGPLAALKLKKRGMMSTKRSGSEPDLNESIQQQSARAFAPQKSELCRYFSMPGGCVRGESCYFAHGEKELLKSRAPPLSDAVHGVNNKGKENEGLGRKVFVGGLSPFVESDDLREFFEENFGPVEDAIVIGCQVGHRVQSRGFGFVTFKHEKSVMEAIKAHYVNLLGKKVEIKGAIPRALLSMVGGNANSVKYEALLAAAMQQKEVGKVNTGSPLDGNGLFEASLLEALGEKGAYNAYLSQKMGSGLGSKLSPFKQGAGSPTHGESSSTGGSTITSDNARRSYQCGEDGDNSPEFSGGSMDSTAAAPSLAFWSTVPSESESPLATASMCSNDEATSALRTAGASAHTPPLLPVLTPGTEPKWYLRFKAWLQEFLPGAVARLPEGEYYPLSALKGDFRATCGMELDHVELGFNKLSDFIRSFSDLCRIKVVPVGRGTAATHMVLLPLAQRVHQSPGACGSSCVSPSSATKTRGSISSESSPEQNQALEMSMGGSRALKDQLGFHPEILFPFQKGPGYGYCNAAHGLQGGNFAQSSPQPLRKNASFDSREMIQGSQGGWMQPRGGYGMTDFERDMEQLTYAEQIAAASAAAAASAGQAAGWGVGPPRSLHASASGLQGRPTGINHPLASKGSRSMNHLSDAMASANRIPSHMGMTGHAASGEGAGAGQEDSQGFPTALSTPVYHPIGSAYNSGSMTPLATAGPTAARGQTLPWNPAEDPELLSELVSLLNQGEQTRRSHHDLLGSRPPQPGARQRLGSCPGSSYGRSYLSQQLTQASFLHDASNVDSGLGGPFQRHNQSPQLPESNDGSQTFGTLGQGNKKSEADTSDGSEGFMSQSRLGRFLQRKQSPIQDESPGLGEKSNSDVGLGGSAGQNPNRPAGSDDASALLSAASARGSHGGGGASTDSCLPAQQLWQQSGMDTSAYSTSRVKNDTQMLFPGAPMWSSTAWPTAWKDFPGRKAISHPPTPPSGIQYRF
ncbi:hypothetical protein CBR_g32589 [Chara braunii]|uniref:Uncharacterized protein n=1 Tax=Chara braunii TaxID=69332 RepID=A0A388LH48_CHABU|nr:hypothetical protein CBR_g32589 [Chara braunii]|eukprot:GBG81597.1 hypothetical protein CBR_g32589 [Chara braunii]